MSKALYVTIAKASKEYNINPKFVYAVAMVESGGKGFNTNEFPIVRFEKHVFKRYLKKLTNAQALLRKADALKGCGYNTYLDALDIEPHYTMLSTSFGLFQIMGFNHKLVGYDTVEEFVKAMTESIDNQVDAFFKFVTNRNLLTAINKKDFVKFAYSYNGPNYSENNYDVKLKKIYDDIKIIVG